MIWPTRLPSSAAPSGRVTETWRRDARRASLARIRRRAGEAIAGIQISQDDVRVHRHHVRRDLVRVDNAGAAQALPQRGKVRAFLVLRSKPLLDNGSKPSVVGIRDQRV
jgi:hypothetical protein